MSLIWPDDLSLYLLMPCRLLRKPHRFIWNRWSVSGRKGNRRSLTHSSRWGMPALNLNMIWSLDNDDDGDVDDII